jgi:hypothetical protein
MRHFWLVLRILAGVVVVAFWVQSTTTFPGWLTDAAHDLSRDNGVGIIRTALIVCGLIVALVALGPARLSAWRDALYGRPPATRPSAGTQKGSAVRPDQSAGLQISAETSGVGSHRLPLDDRNMTDHDEWLVTANDFRTTNHSDAPMNIEVFLLVPHAVGDKTTWLRVQEGEWRRRQWMAPNQLGHIEFQGPYLESPFTLAPKTTVRGTLGFTSPGLRSGDADVVPPYTKIQIVDHISEQEATLPLMGGRYPQAEPSDEKGSTSVTSHNQSGGITAHTVDSRNADDEGNRR